MGNRSTTKDNNSCYIVFDLEWNQASSKSKEVKELMFEILEIGAVKVDKNFNIIDKYSSLIRPQVYMSMHTMTQKIVHLNFEALKKERDFPTVMEEFLSWCGASPVFCTWGSLDLMELQRNMAYYNMKPLSNGPLEFYDVQKLFSIRYEDGKLRRSLEAAAEYLDIEKKGEFHRALFDAYYTAQVLVRINDEQVMKYHSYDMFTLPKTREDEVFIEFPDYSKYISVAFKNRSSALSDKEVRRVCCNICGGKVKKVIKWFTPNGGKYYLGVSRCESHGLLKSKLRVKKLDEDKVYIVKTTKLINTETYESIRNKYEK